MLDIPIFVITDESGRQLALTKFLEANQIEFIISKAVYFDRQPSSFHSQRSYLLSRRKLSLRELGCAQAHQNVYEVIIQEKIPMSLVFEEDVSISDLNLLLRSIREIQEMNIEQPLVASFHTENAELHRKQKMYSTWERCYSFPSGANAYLINFEAAQKFRASNSNLDFVADWPPAKGIIYLLQTEPSIHHTTSGSMIEDSRRLNDLTSLVKLKNILDLLLFFRFFRINRFVKLKLNTYFSELYLPVILRIIRKYLKMSKTFKSSF